MNEQTKNALEDTVNSILLSLPREIDLDGGDLKINYALINEGIIITDSYMSFIIDGTIHAAG